METHIKDSQRGQYPPKPADLIAQLEGIAAGTADYLWSIPKLPGLGRPFDA